jgi:hypothetical protein
MQIDTDVLVVGGGTAGVAAALAAAELGVRVTIAERDGIIGGVATRANVHCYWKGSNGGIQRAIDRRTRDWSRRMESRAFGFHPEARRTAVEHMLAKAGVHILYHALAADVILQDKRLIGVVLETVDQTIRVNAVVTIDATGDGDVCALAGVPFTLGRSWDNVANCYSIIPRYYEPEKKRLSYANFDAGWVDPTDSWEISRAYLDGRRCLHQRAAWGTTRPAPAWARHIVSIAPQIGIREGRCIQGEYRLQLADFFMDRRFDDVVMRCYSHYDTHAYDMANEDKAGLITAQVMGFWALVAGCDVPYRSFLPLGVDSLLIGCRALAQEHDTNMALRMQRDIQKVGEVAGTAAALCCIEACTPKALDVAKLQARLIDRGVLKETDLTRESRPWITLDGASRHTAGWSSETASHPDRIARLVAALGTPDEGKALWWLSQVGTPVVANLTEVLTNPHTLLLQKRGAALALALLRVDAGASYLVEAVARRDSDRLPGPISRVPERWIACLIGLQILKHKGAITILLDRLLAESHDVYILYSLHYFIAVNEKLTAQEKQRVIEVVSQLLQRHDLGDHFPGPQSIRWSIELTAAHLLALCGDNKATEVFQAYQADARGFVRRAARTIQQHIKTGEAPAGAGTPQQIHSAATPSEVDAQGGHA